MAAAKENRRLSALLPAWAWTRVGCCVGVLILVQNGMLFYWGTRLSGKCSKQPQVTTRRSTTTTTIDSVILEVEKEIRKVEEEQAEREKKFLETKDSEIAGLREQVRQLSPLRTSQPEEKVNQFSETAELATALLPTTRSALRPDSSLFEVPREALRLFGHEVPSTVQFAVGFSSNPAQQRALMDVVGLIFGLPSHRGSAPLSSTERGLVVAIVHLADPNTQWVTSVAGQLKQEYASLVSSGHLHAMHAPVELYPKLDVCPPNCTFRDTPAKVHTRSKLNIDLAWLMYYATPLAPYFLLVEDDMHFAPNWVVSVHDYLMSEYPPTFVSGVNAPWRMLNFIDVGIGGRLFQSNELSRTAQFLLLFYDQRPSNSLLLLWIRAMTQGSTINYTATHKTPLFQHMPFEANVPTPQAPVVVQEPKVAPVSFNNPPGKAFSDMTVVPTFVPLFAYTPSGSRPHVAGECNAKVSPAAFEASKRCFFWAKAVEGGNHLTVVFDAAIKPTALFVEFGHAAHQTDTLKHGAVEVAPSKSPRLAAAVGQEDPDPCGNFARLLKVEGETVAFWERGGTPPELPVQKVRCFRIVALQHQVEWLIVQSMQVRT